MMFFQVGVDGNAYHKACFKCSYGGCHISPSNYVAHEHQLYCKHHHAQLFMAKGNFSQFDKQHEPNHGVPNGVTENTTEVWWSEIKFKIGFLNVKLYFEKSFCSLFFLMLFKEDYLQDLNFFEFWLRVLSE